MKALIHIGIPKSGTSSIQAFLAMNRAALAEQGLLYAPFNPAFGSQFELPVTALEACGCEIAPDLERRRLGFRNPNDQRAYVAEYARFLEARLLATELPHFIASSEHIQAWLTTRERIAALDEFLRVRFSQVTYLLYLRSQEELITSGYSEAIRRGARHDFATHLDRHGKIDHWRALKRWLEVVSRDRLELRLMTRDALVGGDLLQDFCAVAGIDLTGLKHPPRVNTSLTQEEIALRRRLNAVLPVQARSGGLNPLYTSALRLLRPLFPGQGRLRLTGAQVATLRARNHESNEKIRKRFFYHREALF